jgi:glutaredoxin
MTARILLFTQPGCLSCQLMKVFLEAKEIPFEEFDISVDVEACRQMTERHGSHETPTLVIVRNASQDIAWESATHVVTGFDPERLDQLLEPPPSSDSVTEP